MLRLLICDDSPEVRAAVRTMLAEDGKVEIVGEAGSGERAIAIARSTRPDVVLMDVSMPGIGGVEATRRLRAEMPTLRIVAFAGSDASETIHRMIQAGADAYCVKGVPLWELERVVAGQGEPLLGMVAMPPGVESPAGRDRETVTALASALGSKDTLTEEHSQRVQRYGTELAGAVEPALLEDPSLEYGFLLHDVGKIGIPDRILQKPGPLTPDERRTMEAHTILGEQMLGEVALLQGEGLRVVRCHHERWDGTGYPDGLEGTAIPLGARIFAVADTVDAITSRRPYRSAASWDTAVAEIANGASHQFDPDIVDGFVSSETRLRGVHDELASAPGA